MKVPKIILQIESSRGFGRDLLTGISNYSRLHGPWSFYLQDPFFISSRKVEKTLSRLKKGKFDGIIARQMSGIQEIEKLRIPAIIASTVKEKSTPEEFSFPIITTDNQSIGEIAAEHLLSRGFQNFAFCGYDEIDWSNGRKTAFCDAVSQKGYSVYLYEQPKLKRDRHWENEQKWLIEWLSSLPKPIGLMTCSDDRSQNVIEASKICGLRVPEQIAVIGVDDDKLVCNLSNPPLSSISLNSVSAGYEAAELLDRLMNGEPMTKQKIIVKPTHVEIRMSTNILAVKDPNVAMALSFIREHAKEDISVDDVVEATSLSRRVLESRFKNILNKSILKEIRQTRVEQIIKMLCETNISIKEIAEKLGYTGTDHISRYFRKEKGVSLLEYRRQYDQK